MTRINTNVQSLIAQRVLGQNNGNLANSLERLSTGLRINRGKDDPSGLIASQNLRAEQAGLRSAIKNAERADQVVNIAEGGLNEVSALLTELQGLVTQSANDAGLSAAEKEANQLQVDSILQTIDRVAGSTAFQGDKLLNGNRDYKTEDVSAVVGDFRVNTSKLEFGQTVDVEVTVTTSAQVGGFLLSFGAANIDLATQNSEFVLEISGKEGSREISFASGTALDEIRDVINSFTSVTGVEAALSGTDDIRITSTARGSDEFVSVKVVDDGGITGGGINSLDADDTNAVNALLGAFTSNPASNGFTDEGQDIEAFVNGQRATTKGDRLRINTDFLDVDINLANSGGAVHSQALGALTAFTITGGGADFQLGGNVNISEKVSLGIENVAVRNLGQSQDGAATYFLADLGSGKQLNMADGDIAEAQKVVTKAIEEVSSQRGRLGAFQKNTIGSTLNSLNVTLENTTAAESVIRDADFALESAALTRNQVLSQSAQNILSLANQQPQSALGLLG